MTKHVTIRTVTNPSFPAHVAPFIDSETRHRTTTSAMRRLKSVARKARIWSEMNRNWGSIDILKANGDEIDTGQDSTLWQAVEWDDTKLLARELGL